MCLILLDSYLLFVFMVVFVCIMLLRFAKAIKVQLDKRGVEQVGVVLFERVREIERMNE